MGVIKSRVEELVRTSLAGRKLQDIDDGFRLVVGDSDVDFQRRTVSALRTSGDLFGWTELRFFPRDEVSAGLRLLGIAEIETEFAPSRIPDFTALGIARLNAQSVYGAFYAAEGGLRLRAQYSLYQEESAPDFAANLILHAFGEQLPVGYAIAWAQSSSDEFIKRRAALDSTKAWANHVEQKEFEEAAQWFRSRGFFASPADSRLCLEVALSGDHPAVIVNAEAQTAFLNVTTVAPHPLAGVGYLSTIALPIDPLRGEAVEACRRLNEFEMTRGDYPPRLGAWGLRGLDDELVYSSFLPISAQLSQLHMTVMNWNLVRTIALRDQFWDASLGVTFDRPEGRR